MAKTKEEYKRDYYTNRVIEEMLIELGKKYLLEKNLMLDFKEIEEKVNIKLSTNKGREGQNKWAGLVK